jgi:hypothetical protein
LILGQAAAKKKNPEIPQIFGNFLEKSKKPSKNLNIFKIPNFSSAAGVANNFFANTNKFQKLH